MGGNDPPDPPGVISWLPSNPVDLLAGATYWITFDGSALGDVTWNYNSMLQSGYSELEFGLWQTTNGTLGAIQILGEAENQGPGGA